jgi:hypothetical protein
MTYEQREYFRRREAQERAAAKSARNVVARRAHQQLAEEYAALLHGMRLIDPVTSLRSCGAL